MKKKGQGAIVAMSIGAILLVVILAVIFSTLTAQTTTTTVTDDPFTAINETCVRLTTDCYTPGSLTIVNASDNINALTNFTECGDSSVLLFGARGDISGCVSCENTLGLNASYGQRSCGFITSGTTRTIINLLPVLLGIAILIFIVGFIVLKK